MHYTPALIGSEPASDTYLGYIPFGIERTSGPVLPVSDRSPLSDDRGRQDEGVPVEEVQPRQTEQGFGEMIGCAGYISVNSFNGRRLIPLLNLAPQQVWEFHTTLPRRKLMTRRFHIAVAVDGIRRSVEGHCLGGRPGEATRAVIRSSNTRCPVIGSRGTQ